MTEAHRIRPIALVRGLCPRCGRGRIFEPLLSPRLLEMHSACPECGLEFEREPGYFTMSMYLSYFIGIFTVLPVALFLALIVHASLAVTLVVALAQTLLTALFAFRYSRILWIHVDQALEPR
ncbi:MAG TPA: DUF983 domain-containing protein [Dehalococcoidia bacterium]